MKIIEKLSQEGIFCSFVHKKIEFFNIFEQKITKKIQYQLFRLSILFAVKTCVSFE